MPLAFGCLALMGGLLVSTASVFAFSKHIRFRYYYYRFTNASALISLDQDSPFIMLRCTNSGDRLAPHQSVGCRCLVSELWTAGRRQLRFKLPADSRPSKKPSAKIRMKKSSAKIRMNPLPSLFHVIATSPAELPDPISIPTGPPPT